MPARRKTAKPPKRRNPVAKALRVVKPKVVEDRRRAYKRRPKHPAPPADESAGE
jgi:hypothetical protein